MLDNLHDAHILLVDDDMSNLELLEEIFRSVGFKDIQSVTSGSETLLLVEENVPDLILLDVLMSGMDGLETTRKLRAQLSGHFVPILLISALNDPDVRVRGLEAGANDFVSRMLEPEELLARVESLLTLKQARDELEAERKRLALLYDIGRSLTSQLDYQPLMWQVVSLTTSLTGAAKTIIYLLDEDGEFRERISARVGEEPHISEHIEPIVLSKGLVGWVIANRKAVLLDDVTQDDRWIHLPEDETDAVVSAVAVPLYSGGDVSGVLLLVAPERGAFTRNHLDLLTAIARQATIALDNARLYEEMRQQRARVEALLNATGDPVIAVDPAQIITQVNPAARKALHLTEREVLGQPLESVFSITLADLVYRAEEHGAPVSGEYTVRKLMDQDQRTYNVSVSPVTDMGFVLVWRDVSALKEGERVRLATERAQTERVLEVFSRYMSPALIDRVLEDRNIINRRERRAGLVMFADLRGFTRLTVEHHPDAVIELLNDIFAELIDIVYEHEGVVFDIVGDELMVGFNVPYDQPDARRRALVTAVRMQQRFVELKKRWQKRGMIVGLGIGINAGQVVLGHVGGRSRMNYAMVGEAVNIAHRLVELAQDGHIVVTPDVLSQGLPDEVALIVKNLPPRRIKGKDQAQPIVRIELQNRPSGSDQHP